MIDPELKTSLSEINKNLVDLKNKRYPGIWRAFFQGVFSAFGYLVGLVLVIVLVGWFLNKIGVLPEFQKQIKDFETFMGSAQRLMEGSSNSQQQNTNQNSQGSYIITLPDGRKAEVTPQ